MKGSRVLLWLAAIGFFMETLDSTIVNTAIPAMARSLGESPFTMQSVVITYSLMIALLIPASGWVVDRFGTRHVYLTAIILFTLGSISCASSHSLIQLVISRAIQGVGGSMLLPVGRLAVLRAFPGDEFISAIGFVTVPALIGPLLGPTLGGWLVQFASWHWIFLINIPIGIIGAIATYHSMPDDRITVRRVFDFPGFFLLSIAMVSISVALDGIAELGFQTDSIILLIILGLASFSAYWLRAPKQHNPLFSPKLFQVSTYTLGLLGNLFARLGSSSMPFLIPLFLQVGLDDTPLQSGMTMIPVAVAGIIGKRWATPLILKFGHRNILVFNTFLVGIGISSFCVLSKAEPTLLRIMHLFLFGTVNSIQFTAMNTLTLKDLDRNNASSGNSLFSMVQMLAMSFSVAAAAAILGTFMNRFHAHGDALLSIKAFHTTFVCMGTLTCISVWIFWQLSPHTKAKPPTTATAPLHVEPL